MQVRHPDQTAIWSCWFLWREENWRARRNPPTPNPLSKARTKTNSNGGPVSRKSRIPFGLTKPFLVGQYLKIEKCIRQKLLHIKNMWKVSSVIMRFEILLRFSGCKIYSGPSRNGLLKRTQRLRPYWREACALTTTPFLLPKGSSWKKKRF